MQIADVQQCVGESFIWDREIGKNDCCLLKAMQKIGADQVDIGGRRVWSNSGKALSRLSEEKDRRRWRSERSFKSRKEKSWKTIAEEAIEEQLTSREEDADQYEIPTSAGRLIIEKGNEIGS